MNEETDNEMEIEDDIEVTKEVDKEIEEFEKNRKKPDVKYPIVKKDKTKFKEDKEVDYSKIDFEIVPEIPTIPERVGKRENGEPFVFITIPEALDAILRELREVKSLLDKNGK